MVFISIPIIEKIFMIHTYYYIYYMFDNKLFCLNFIHVLVKYMHVLVKYMHKIALMMRICLNLITH